MSKEIQRLARVKRDMQKIAAVTSDKRLLARMDTILSSLDFLLEKMADEPSREDYIRALDEVMETSPPSMGTARVIDKIMQNIEQGIWEIPEEKESKENG